ncbi:MAG: Lrp/AsnC family transcriptional regulator [Omnitrophica bacterium]|nr:Lrp/AsnC family transcriptional regulator [Candidatus Omnitrophota bacterium]
MCLSTVERKILKHIQEEIPLDARPFKILADKIGIEENELLSKIIEFKNKGFLRKFQASLNHAKLGFKSTLLGLKVPEEKLEKLVKEIVAYKEITHCFLRENEHNLWVVFIYKNDALEKFLEKISAAIGKENISNLKTLKKFKLNTHLDLQEATPANSAPLKLLTKNNY